MNLLEAAAIIGKAGSVLYWHTPADRTGGSLPDSRALWNVIWENRDNISGIAHSHPGNGVPGPSQEDVTTFAAIEAALGRRLNWWIASGNRLIVARWVGSERLTYGIQILNTSPRWLQPLREASNSLSDARLASICREILAGSLDKVEELRKGNEALGSLVERVLDEVPHADPRIVKGMVQDILFRK